jgi:FtsP/CotA-like multicopper oxidase with cupredoxin domain
VTVRKPFRLWMPILILVMALVAGAVVWSLPTIGRTDNQPADQACDVTEVDKEVTLFAENIGKSRVGYGLRRGQASIPGPTMEMTEGECIAVTLKNRSDRKASLHAHGVDYTRASDGTRLTRSCIGPGKDRTYVWQAHTDSLRTDGSVEPGSAGYWHYHDHCRMGEHGTRGIYAGMFGALIVRAPDDPVPDVEPCVLVMIGTTFAFKRAPNTPVCEANLGQRVEFVVITHGDEFHTFHLHGHRWADTRSGALETLDDPSRIIDNKTTGPADSFGFQVIAGERVGPGAWMYHCHVQNHSDLGMSGIFLVKDEEGRITPDAQRALDAFQGGHHH